MNRLESILKLVLWIVSLSLSVSGSPGSIHIQINISFLMQENTVDEMRDNAMD